MITDWELTVLLLIQPQWYQDYPGHFGTSEVCLSLSQQGQVVPGKEQLVVRPEKEALFHWTRGERHRSSRRRPVMFPFHLRSVIEMS